MEKGVGDMVYDAQGCERQHPNGAILMDVRELLPRAPYETSGRKQAPVYVSAGPVLAASSFVNAQFLKCVPLRSSFGF